MPRTFTCQHCGKVTTRNPRSKKRQKYCSFKGCQNARKRAFDKKVDSTPKGKLLRKQRNKRWRENRPAHEYQRSYRNLHPEYVSCNREKQKNRNKKYQKESCSMIVKTDALMLQMHIQQGIETHLSQKPG